MCEADIGTIGISGAAGYLGANLITRLLEQHGVQLRLLEHSTAMTLPDPAHHRCPGDLVAGTGIDEWLEGCAVVVHLAYLWHGGEAVNLKATRNLVDACVRQGIRRMVHVSTAAVVGRTEADWVDENTPCHPVTEYGQTKLQIEQAMLEAASGSGLDLVILRPTSVFGPGGAPLTKLCGDLLAGPWFKNYLKACLFGRRAMNLVHVDNVVAAILFAIACPDDFRGLTLMVSDDDAPANNFLDVEQMARTRLGIGEYPLPVIPFPSPLLSMLLRLMGRNMINPVCRFRGSRIRKLGFQPVRDFGEGLQAYLDGLACAPKEGAAMAYGNRQ